MLTKHQTKGRYLSYNLRFLFCLKFRPHLPPLEIFGVAGSSSKDSSTVLECGTTISLFSPVDTCALAANPQRLLQFP